MSLELLENILKQLDEGRGTFVDQRLETLWTAHYNEVLLYKDLEGMLALMSKYKFFVNIHTNCIALTKQKIDLLAKYSDSIKLIVMNLPSDNAERWSELVGKPASMYHRIEKNLAYMYSLPELNGPGKTIICLNSVSEDDSHVQVLDKAPTIDLTSEKDATYAALKQKYPLAAIYHSVLIDRSGFLKNEGVITNSSRQEGKQVVGCSNVSEFGEGNRVDNFIHINANGEVFICCNDYEMTTIYGDLKTHSLKEIWQSQEHQEMIATAYKTICQDCLYAIWE
jgi:radical SAM protein with 4Fe4S-binding SPASM domain